MDLRIADKTALVLGASRGLGEAIAKGLAAEGVRVFAAARSRGKIEAWSKDLDNVTALELDLSDVSAIDATIDRLIGDGGVDILINNGGGPPPGTAQDVERDDWIRHFETMVANMIHLTMRLLPGMKERGWGRIVTVTSTGIEQPIPTLVLSNGIRSALVGWSKTLAGEVAADGITVNIVMPGRIQTPRVDELDASIAEREGMDVKAVAERAAGTIPAGRYGTPEEFANMVVFLASDRASYVTGDRIRIDGGATRSI